MLLEPSVNVAEGNCSRGWGSFVRLPRRLVSLERRTPSCRRGQVQHLVHQRPHLNKYTSLPFSPRQFRRLGMGSAPLATARGRSSLRSPDKGCPQIAVRKRHPISSQGQVSARSPQRSGRLGPVPLRCRSTTGGVRHFCAPTRLPAAENVMLAAGLANEQLAAYVV